MATIGSPTRPVYVGTNGEARPCDLDLHDVSVENKGDNDTIAIVTIDGIPYPIKNFKLGGNAFVVDFLDHDRTNLKKEPVLKGGNAMPPDDPTWTGHTFTGWDGNYENVQQDEEVLAVYSISKYWVLFRNADGSKFEQKDNVEHGTLLGTVKPTTNPTKASTAAKDFTFKAWNLADNYAIVGNTTVDPTWNETARKYNVTFRRHNVGTGIDNYTQIGDVQSVEYGKSATAPDYPTVSGYSRGSRTWDKSYSSITADTVVTVEYRKTYDITFKPNGGKLDGETDDVKRTGIEYLSTMSGVTKPTASKDGSTFSKWTYAANPPTGKSVGDEVADTDQVIDNYVINANYSEIIKRKLTIAVSGENYCSSITPTKGDHEYEDGEIVTLSATASYTGLFDGWTGDVYYDSTDYKYKVKMDSDKTVTASFLPDYRQVTCSIDPTGGGTVSGTGTYIYGDSCTLTAKAASGYTFDHWDDDTTKTSTTLKFEVTYGNFDHVAHFVKSTVTVTYYQSKVDWECAIVCDPVYTEEVEVGKVPTGTTPTCTGLTFQGWIPQDDAPTFGQPVETDVVYTATWTGTTNFSANSKLPFDINKDSPWPDFNGYTSKIHIGGTIKHTASPDHKMGLSLYGSSPSFVGEVLMAKTTITADGSATQTINQDFTIEEDECENISSYRLNAVKETSCSVAWVINLDFTFYLY